MAGFRCAVSYNHPAAEGVYGILAATAAPAEKVTRCLQGRANNDW